MYDGQRNHDGPRPRRHLINEATRQEHDFGRNGRAVLARIEIEQAQVDLDVTVGGLDATARQDAVARTFEPPVLWRDACEFQREIRLNRSTQLRRALWINIEAAVGKLPC